MITNDQINNILGTNDSYKQPAKLLELMLDEKQRIQAFYDFLELETNMSYEWFQEAYELEHADRKGNKQDFTPHSVANLITRLTLDDSPTHYFESACGNGGIMIQHWNEQRLRVGIGNYNPKSFWYQVEELSDRSLPFLIFNMAIRGMNGTILHGDSIERVFKDVYFIRNMRDDYGGFSEVIKMPKTEVLQRELKIEKWSGSL